MSNPPVNLELVSAPASRALTLAEAKAHLRVDGTDEDTYITDLIEAAEELVESRLGHAMVSRTYRLHLDRFPLDGDRFAPDIRLPMWPVASSGFSIKYTDPATGTEATLDAGTYVLHRHAQPAVVRLAEGKSWPTVNASPSTVRIEFVAGLAQASVDERIKQVTRQLVGHWFANREAVVTGTIATEVPASLEHLFDNLGDGSLT